MGQVLRVRRKVLGQLLVHAQRQPHRECCGLVAGRDGVIARAFPADNVAIHPAKYYEIAPKQIVSLMRELRERRLGFLGIYHSHPNTENVPSARDIELAYYAEASYFIVNPRPYAVKPVRAFSIRAGSVRELGIQVV
jgi:[CysO sulfur-carrier protein]-S-L-cysteine hydrolase